MDIRLATTSLEAAGFTVEEREAAGGSAAQMEGYQRTECLSATRSGSMVSICLHAFENSDTAIDAGTAIGLESADRRNFVVGNVVVEIDAGPGAEEEGQQALEALRNA